MADYRTVDARGLKCPMPIVKAKKEIDAIPAGEVLRVIATDPGLGAGLPGMGEGQHELRARQAGGRSGRAGPQDVRAPAEEKGMTAVATTEMAIDPAIRAYVDERLAELRARQPDDRVTLVVFSGELDRNLAALVIATGAAAMGLEVSVFYTFWGLSALKRRPTLQGKGLKEKLFALMTPRRLNRMPVSRMNFGGRRAHHAPVDDARQAGGVDRRAVRHGPPDGCQAHRLHDVHGRDGHRPRGADRRRGGRRRRDVPGRRRALARVAVRLSP